MGRADSPALPRCKCRGVDLRYRADAERLTEPLDGLSAIYHRRSGHTHLVAAPIPEILAALDRGEAVPNEFARHLAELIAIGLVEEA